MPDRQTPIRGQSATFSVNGAKRGDAVLLLYPDELAAVNTRSIGTWVYVLVPAVYLAVWFSLFHRIGWALVSVWYVAGWWAWQALARRRAARKVAAGGDGVTAIPLDQVTSVQCRRGRKAASWLGVRTMTVTTADGSQYEFRGKTGSLQTDIGRVLAGLGRDVRATTAGLAVTSQLLADG